MKKFIAVLFGVGSLCLLFQARPALAATIVVNSTAQNPGAVGDCTLGEAIIAANTDTAVDGCIAGSGADTITLPAGRYELTELDNSGGGAYYFGLPPILSDITISGAGADTTIIERAASAPSFRIMYINGQNIVLRGMTVRGGGADTGDPFIRDGGGIGIVDYSTVTLEAMTLTENKAGAIADNGNLTVIGSKIENNFGAGISLGQSRAHPPPLAQLTVIDSQINGNLGGGIGGFQVTIRHSNITNNGGDGLYLGGPAYVYDSTISHNGGNGLTAGAGGDAGIKIENSAIFGNYAWGLWVGGTPDGSIQLTNSTIADNSGGVVLGKGGVALRITNTTIHSNYGHGGILNRDKKRAIVLVNSILAGNYGKRGADCVGKLISRGRNIFGSLDRCVVKLKKGDRVADPLLGDWVDDRTPGNGHYPLLPTSPAINRADVKKCPTTDQLGAARVGRCDIGAVEYLGVH